MTCEMVKGNERAYRIFYREYFDRLFRYLLVVTAGNEDAAREALQGTLTRVVQHIRPFSAENVFWSWLTVLARSALFDQSRKRRRYLAFLDRFARHAIFETPAGPDEGSDSRLSDLLKRHTAALPVQDKELLEAKYTRGQSVREIADQLHTTEKAVESRLVRIRGKLKEKVLEELKREPRIR